jgi:adenylylsulfate kinase-like enzyme
VVIVITGPIASGKSTVARELEKVLTDRGTRTAVIDLDEVAGHVSGDGSAPGESNWTMARRETATRANAYEADGFAVVIADGSFNMPDDRAALEVHLRATTLPIYVTLQVSFEEALRRAQGDPSRGRSRDREFLRSYFAGRRAVLATPSAGDLVIDTEGTTAIEVAAKIARHLQPKHVP